MAVSRLPMNVVIGWRSKNGGDKCALGLVVGFTQQRKGRGMPITTLRLKVDEGLMPVCALQRCYVTNMMGDDHEEASFFWKGVVGKVGHRVEGHRFFIMRRAS